MEEYNDSWLWKNLLNLRVKVRKYIVQVIGNGQKTNMWFDQWSSLGILKDIITTRSINNARLSESMKVNEMIHNGKWRWPNDWNMQYPFLDNLVVPQLMLNEDTTKWKVNDGSLYEFSTRMAWEHICQQQSKVKWDKVVWFSQCNPRMAFILWMAIKGRLQTQDRIQKWNNDPNIKCSLCSSVNDSHTHLFFECDYSKFIWEALKDKMEYANVSNTWESIIEQYSNDKCNNTIGSILKRIVLATSVYHIWKERNARRFTGEAIGKSNLLKIIEDNIKLQLVCLKVMKSNNVLRVANRWNVEMNYVKA